MPLTIPTSSQSDIISSLRQNNLTTAANAVFFGSGGLSGAIRDTGIDYTPTESTILNPSDFPDLSMSQISALQGQINNQVDQLNLNKQKVINQFNQQRQGRIQQNEDALATTQQLFSVVGGINPLQSGRNAGALTGSQAAVRQDLVSLFNTANQSVQQLDIAGSQIGTQGLNAAIDANLKMSDSNFNKGLQLTDRLGTFVDKNGNVQSVAGQTGPTSTLNGQQVISSIDLANKNFDLNSQQVQNSIDLQNKNFALNAQNQFSNLFGYVTGPDGNPLYRLNDGTPTSNPNDPNIQRTYKLKNGAGFTTNPNDPNRDTTDLGTATLYRNDQMLQNQLNYLQSLQTSLGNALSNTTNGIYINQDAKGNKTVNIANIQNYGLDLAQMRKGNIASGGTAVTDAVETMLENVDKYSGAFNKIFFDTQNGDKSTSSVLFRASEKGKPAGYYAFQVNDPNVEVPESLPNAQKGQKFLDYIRLNPISDQTVAIALQSLANSSGGKIVALNTADSLLKNLNSATGDDYDKRLYLRAMAAQQVNGDIGLLADTKVVQKFGQELNDFVKNDLVKFVDGIVSEYQKGSNADIVNKVNDKGVLALALQGTKFDFNNPDLKGDDADKAKLFKSILEYGSELATNYGPDRKNDSQEFFKATISGLLNGVGSNDLGLVNSLTDIANKSIVKDKRQPQAAKEWWQPFVQTINYNLPGVFIKR